MLSVLVDRSGSFVTRAFSAVRLIVCGTGNDRSGTFRREAKTSHFSKTGRDGRLPTSLVLDLPRRRFRWYGGRAGALEGRSPHNRGNWFAGVAEVRLAASSSSLDVSRMRERIMWLRCFIPLVTCVDSATRLFGRVSQETRVPSTHMNTLPAQAHTWLT